MAGFFSPPGHGTYWHAPCRKVRTITAVRALPKMAPIVQAKQISPVLVIARAPSPKTKGVFHLTSRYLFAYGWCFLGPPSVQRL